MSVTAVPIRPIRKGSVARLWIALALLALIAGAVAWFGTAGQQWSRTESGLQYQVIEEGEGASPSADDIALINYTGRLADGAEFESNMGEEPAPLPVSGSIPGFSEALQMMSKGAYYRIRIPSDLAYGPEERRDPRTGEVVIPANATLEFDLRLVDFRSLTVEERQQMEMLRMLQEQAAQGQLPTGQ